MCQYCDLFKYCSCQQRESQSVFCKPRDGNQSTMSVLVDGFSMILYRRIGILATFEDQICMLHYVPANTTTPEKTIAGAMTNLQRSSLTE